MIDLNKKINKPQIFIDEPANVSEFIKIVLEYNNFAFSYKNIVYQIFSWDSSKWAVQMNSYEDADGPIPNEVFFDGTYEGLAKLLETYRMHDGVLLYDALTKRSFWKYFGDN